MTENVLLFCLFFLVSVSSSAIPLFLGMPDAATISSVCCVLLTAIPILNRHSNAAKLRWPALAFAFAMALMLCILGGEGNFLHPTWDWLFLDAVLTDIARQPWPVTYHFQDQDWLLRAPIGTYVIPALAGKLSGYPIEGLGLLAQNAILLTLIFYLIIPTGSSMRETVVIILVFCIFSGWDIIGVALKYFGGAGPPQTSHIERWAELFQYSSAITQIFWAPQHAISGWAFVCIYLKWMRSEASAGLVLSSVPLLAFWSPLTAFGMMPFAIHAGVSTMRRRRLTYLDGLSVIAAIAAAFPMLFYEQIEAGSVPYGFPAGSALFWLVYPVFIALEVLPYVSLIWFAWGRVTAINKTAIKIAVVSLLLIPLYSLGPYNDFAMRASIPALAMLAAIIGLFCATLKGRPGWISMAAASLAIGAVTGGLEIGAAFLPKPDLPRCNLVQVWQMIKPEMSFTNYIVPVGAVPGWFITRHVLSSAGQTDNCHAKT